MKRYIFIAAAALLGAASCNKFVDLAPTTFYSESVVWNGSEANLDKYVYGLYAAVRDRSELYNSNMRDFTDAYSDLVKTCSYDQYGQSYNICLLEETTFTSAGASAFEIWSDSYSRIKRENQFLRDAAANASKYSDSFLRTRVAEVRFIRALSYFYLIRVYGGVVIRGDGVDGPSQNSKPRSGEADSWSYVMGNLRSAAEDLPASWTSNYYGRATKAAAYGFLSRAALYKACALKNAGAPADSVAKAYQDVIDAADACASQPGVGLVADYASLFSNQVNKENLFTVSFFGNDVAKGLSHRGDVFFRPRGDSQFHDGAPVYAVFGPTSELVDSYEMADGTPFSWETYGTDPYAGREPRFYATILYNGATWEKRTIRTYDQTGYAAPAAPRLDSTSPDGYPAEDKYPYDYIAKFETSGSPATTVTGYYMRKWITEGDTDWIKNGGSHYWIALRYAEVILNKAEAQAQNGDVPSALITLQQVRDRVGLPAPAAATLDDFMKVLEHERIVELAGEGFRYWDLRRWRRAVEVINGKQAHGCWITRASDGTLTYKQVEVDAGKNRVFLDRYYAFAIPEEERNTNPALNNENNPGW